MPINTNNEYSKEDMRSVTQGTMNILDEWGISSDQVYYILGLSKLVKKRHIQGYRMGERVFPHTEELLTRIDHIVGISEALRTTFPFSKQMRLLWLRRPHRRFKKSTPLNVILTDDTLNGLVKVRMEVDCAYGYAISESMRTKSTGS